MQWVVHRVRFATRYARIKTLFRRSRLIVACDLSISIWTFVDQPMSPVAFSEMSCANSYSLKLSPRHSCNCEFCSPRWPLLHQWSILSSHTPFGWFLPFARIRAHRICIHHLPPVVVSISLVPKLIASEGGFAVHFGAGWVIMVVSGGG